MIRQPPRSTRFPCATLFRSRSRESAYQGCPRTPYANIGALAARAEQRGRAPTPALHRDRRRHKCKATAATRESQGRRTGAERVPTKAVHAHHTPTSELWPLEQGSAVGPRGQPCILINDTTTAEIYTLSLRDALPI